ncbi:Metacaspase pca1 [Mycena indigotica]|uniref:Metacaspase pca1 n=1 Tax=Mycena indigotica TaxID=2126181 RepID=A0A8H6SRT2_9AGAR|nr:Metacaspase pca1 [Mycena indigotica]KAF7304043.1 Metacaspase pca1 [Mycena indigotica]
MTPTRSFPFPPGLALPSSPVVRASSITSPTLPRPPRKRALLIGIQADLGPGYPRLRAAHSDVHKTRSLLLDCYGYAPADITVLLDDGVVGHVQPLAVNVLAAIDYLVKDVRAGDRLFFYYSGHSTQEPNDTRTEEDGMDEFIVPLDGLDHKIKDDDLHRSLVAPLPAGSHLVALLDTCHSGSLLDLTHFRCNRVYVPWRWRRKHDSADVGRRYAAARNNAMLPRNSTAASPGSPTSYAKKRRSATEGEGQVFRLGEKVLFCDSPSSEFCTGWCRDKKRGPWDYSAGLVHADVISLAAAKDSQQAWEGKGAVSLTSCLVDLLRENQDVTLEEVLRSASFAAYKMSLGRHNDAHGRRTFLKASQKKLADWCKALDPTNLKCARACRAILALVPLVREQRKQGRGDMDSFQNPEMASAAPLDMQRKWVM